MANGIFPICAKADPLLIEGVTYRFRRLGLKDGFSLLALLNDIGTWGYSQGEQRFREIFASTDNRAKLFQAVITAMLGVEVTESRIYAWLASTLGREKDSVTNTAPGCEPVSSLTSGSPVQVTAEDLQDPSQFPLDSVVDLVNGISTHPDLESFFSKLRGQSDNPLVKLVTDSQQSSQKSPDQSTPEMSVDPTAGNG